LCRASARRYPPPRIRSGGAATEAGVGRPVVTEISTVFSLIGVLGITVVLFFVVAVSARLILGR